MRNIPLLTKALSSMLVLLLALPLAGCTDSTAAPPEDTQEETTPVITSDIDESKEAQIEAKDEVVYAMLNYDGSVDETYVVNRFRVDTEGSFTDYGNYSTVENLTNIEELTSSGDEVTLASEKGDFYYQGTLKTPELPWLITISYSLDGKEVPAADISSLAGKSGRLGIHIGTKQNPEVDSRFFNHYTLQFTLTLPSDSIENLSAEGAVIASAGSNTQVNYTVLPESEASYDFAVDITDIDVPGISVAAVPFGMDFDLPDTSGISNELGVLVQAISQLSAGVQQSSYGVSAATEGLRQLAAGSSLYNTGLLELDAGSSALSTNSATLSTNLSAAVGGLEQMRPIIEASTIPDEYKYQLLGTIDGLKEISAGYEGLNAGLQQYTGGVSSLASEYAGLNNGLGASVSGMLELTNGMYSLQWGANELYAGVEGMPGEMQKQIDEYAASYDFSGFEPASFVSSKNGKVELVQFVFTTPAIEVVDDDKEENSDSEGQESSIFDKLINLFN